jgi:hypothetical protein
MNDLYTVEAAAAARGSKQAAKKKERRLKKLRERLKELQDHGKRTHLTFVTAKIRFRPYRHRYMLAQRKKGSVKLHSGFMKEYEEKRRPVVRAWNSLKRLEERVGRLIIRIKQLKAKKV